MYGEKSSERHLFSNIKELKARIVELENDVAVLQEKINSFLDRLVVRTFHNVRYADDVRSVYEDLCWGGIMFKTLFIQFWRILVA